MNDETFISLDPPLDRSAAASSDNAGRPVLLEATGLRKTYKTAAGQIEVLRGVDLTIYEGEILAILGTSGCGKSTLLHVLGWLDEVDEGRIVFEGRDRASLSRRERAHLRNEVMGFVFQFYHLMPELTALENVSLPARIRHGRSWRRHHVEAYARAASLLRLVGLADRATHKPRHLSGGERQRVAIARALMNRPRFLFCDEPTGNLDGKTAEDVRAMLWELNAEQNQTMVIVTHDAKLAAQAHRIVQLVDGQIDERHAADLVEELEF